MTTKRLLIDTSVWISYFGDRSSNEQHRINKARQIIEYCQKNQLKLFYCSYVENELNRGKNKNRCENIQKMKTIAENIYSHIGNDDWSQIDVDWKEIGSQWGNIEEVKLGNKLKKQLPDNNKKSNRIDRNIVITAVYQKIDLILHENPKDFSKLNDIEGIDFMNLLEIVSLDDFIKKVC